MQADDSLSLPMAAAAAVAAVVDVWRDATSYATTPGLMLAFRVAHSVAAARALEPYKGGTAPPMAAAAAAAVAAPIATTRTTAAAAPRAQTTTLTGKKRKNIEGGGEGGVAVPPTTPSLVDEDADAAPQTVASTPSAFSAARVATARIAAPVEPIANDGPPVLEPFAVPLSLQCAAAGADTPCPPVDAVVLCSPLQRGSALILRAEAASAHVRVCWERRAVQEPPVDVAASASASASAAAAAIPPSPLLGCRKAPTCEHACIGRITPLNGGAAAALELHEVAVLPEAARFVWMDPHEAQAARMLLSEVAATCHCGASDMTWAVACEAVERDVTKWPLFKCICAGGSLVAAAAKSTRVVPACPLSRTFSVVGVTPTWRAGVGWAASHVGSKVLDAARVQEAAAASYKRVMGGAAAAAVAATAAGTGAAAAAVVATGAGAEAGAGAAPASSVAMEGGGEAAVAASTVACPPT